jgi:hypothetical protein
VSVSRGEFLRRRRCRLIPLAVVFGLILAVLERDSWGVLAVVAAAWALLAATWWRQCRRGRPPAA